MFHQINQVGCAAITDSETPLKQRGGSLAELEHQPDGVVEERVIFRAAAFAALTRFARRALFSGRLQELLLVFRCALAAPEFGDGSDFGLRNKGGMKTMNAG